MKSFIIVKFILSVLNSLKLCKIIPIVLTHGVEIIKDLVHTDYLVIQFIIAVGIWQEGVTISDEQVEDVNYL